MSKEDRYSHLGDEIDDEAPNEQVEDADDAASEIRVTIDDGDDETVLTVDSDAVSADEIRDVIQTAPDDASSAQLPPGVRSVLSTQRIALNMGFQGFVALNEAVSVLSVDEPE